MRVLGNTHTLMERSMKGIGGMGNIMVKEHTPLKGGSILKTGIFGNCVFATFSKNIKHLTFAGCQSEIPLNSSQLLSIPYESEVLLPICYQIFDDVLGRCQGVFYKKRAFYF